MGWEVVKQPNGLYARFTTVTMSNTLVNESRGDMIALLMTKHGLSQAEATRMVDAAEQALPGRKYYGREVYESGRL